MKDVFLRWFTGVVFFVLYAPIFVLIIYSFNSSSSRSVWGGFTLRWYFQLCRNTQVLRATLNTLVIATCASSFAAVLGTLACAGLVNSKKMLQNLVVSLTNLPMINPEIVTGISLMLFFVSFFRLTGFLKPGMITLILAHSMFCAPYVFLAVLPKIKQITPQIPEAAQDLGCTPLQAFFKVLLPEITPGIITGIMMSFTMSLDDFTISYFTSGNVQTLPIIIYSMTRRSISPEINALSALLFLLLIALFLIINLRQGKK
ncbi:MAG: ABC transporter permease [Oscillospiraceae bacterium]|jgi:spermidine/putrescine transport system permease protein|nr:ABC transporter permease [Oscillospiraceae bacterium]